MRRIGFTGLLGAAAVIALTGSALGASPNDSATGSLQIEVPLYGTSVHFNVSAHSDADGTDPRGTITYHEVQWDPSQDGKAKVTCLLVDGNKASIIGEFQGAPETWPFGPSYPYAQIVVVDDGPASADADRGWAQGVGGGDCTAWSFYDGLPVAQGNINVRDAQ